MRINLEYFILWNGNVYNIKIWIFINIIKLNIKRKMTYRKQIIEYIESLVAECIQLIFLKNK